MPHAMKKFGGKWYNPNKYHRTKMLAQKEAMLLRRKGRLARVVKSGDGWATYFR